MTIKRLLICAAVAVGMGLYAPAMAQDAGGAGRGIIAPPRPSPVPPVGWEYVWVAPVYRTVTEQNWVPEKVQWVAEWREISPGRYQQVWRQIVTPGYWQTTTRRVLVSAGHWELVAINPPPPPFIEPPIVLPPVYPPPIIVRNPGTVGVEGYARGGGEDLSKFSPLMEWPK
jgi:hypothetical protein